MCIRDSLLGLLRAGVVVGQGSSQGVTFAAAGQQGSRGAIDRDGANPLALRLWELGQQLLDPLTPTFGLTERAWIVAAELIDEASGIHQG